MFDKLSNDEISTAMDELITCLGVKEETPFLDLIALLQKKDTQGCVQEIAARLLLPIRISLSYVPKDFRPGDTNRFRSSALARTDWTGRGIESITAQVAMPEHLPMFGTSGLQGYTIPVRVSENCNEHPETLVAVMTHELSHVLLQSLYHPKKDSELHTDLVPIILGFRDVVQRGRKTVQSSKSGDVTTTSTTTYGYLTDSQFEFACDKVRGVLQRHQHDKKCSLTLVAKVRRKLCRVTQRLARFRNYLSYLDKHPRKRMRREDALRIVGFHTFDYAREWQITIAECSGILERTESFVRSLTLYTSVAIQQLREYTRSLEMVSEQLDKLTQAITSDVKVLRKYVGLIYRIRSTLWA